MRLVKQSTNQEHLRKQYNTLVLRRKITACETLEELFEIKNLIEEHWQHGDLYKYAYHCLKDEILKKEELLIEED